MSPERLEDECEECGKHLPVDKALTTEDGDYLCENCFEEWWIEKMENYEENKP